jgi:hypothetical protein
MKLMGQLDRRAVVEAYINYDSSKKSLAVPDTNAWDWTSADAIDTTLRDAGYKAGIAAGFTSWERVALMIDDLRECAVVSTISSEMGYRARDLGGLNDAGVLANWRPREPMPSWYGALAAGVPLTPNDPFLLRAAVRTEAPAKWYLEDGSGRATTIVANAERFDQERPVAYGFLGILADPSSSFMCSRFSELLVEHQTL